jgi:hypothetical protein
VRVRGRWHGWSREQGEQAAVLAGTGREAQTDGQGADATGGHRERREPAGAGDAREAQRARPGGVDLGGTRVTAQGRCRRARQGEDRPGREEVDER